MLAPQALLRTCCRWAWHLRSPLRRHCPYLSPLKKEGRKTGPCTIKIPLLPTRSKFLSRMFTPKSEWHCVNALIFFLFIWDFIYLFIHLVNKGRDHTLVGAENKVNKGYIELNNGITAREETPSHGGVGSVRRGQGHAAGDRAARKDLTEKATSEWGERKWGLFVCLSLHVGICIQRIMRKINRSAREAQGAGCANEVGEGSEWANLGEVGRLGSHLENWGKCFRVHRTSDFFFFLVLV